VHTPFLPRARYGQTPAGVLKRHLAERRRDRDDAVIEPPIEHRDVTTIMGQLADIDDEVWRIRKLLEDEDGEEEELPEGDS
jgi:hypothetical protein